MRRKDTLTWQVALLDYTLDNDTASVLVQSPYPDYTIYPAKIKGCNTDTIKEWVSQYLDVALDSVVYMGEKRRKDMMTVFNYMILADVAPPF